MVPTVTFAGETLKLELSFGAYPANDGWACDVVFRSGQEKHSASLTGDGARFVGTVAAASTAEWSPGVYDWHAIVSKDGETYVPTQGTLAVNPNPNADGVALTAFEQQLQKVDAAIAAVVAGEGVASYTIQTAVGSRQIQRMSLADLRAHRRWLEDKIAAERTALGQKPKRKQWVRIGNRFHA